MPSEEDRAILVQAFNNAIWPTGAPRLEDAWLGIYQLLLWYAHGFVHIREANDLRKPRWQQRASLAEAYISQALGIAPNELPNHVDRMMQLPRWHDVMVEQGTEVVCPHCAHEFVLPSEMQRNNSLGNGLRILVAECLRRWGNPALDYHEEARATTWFPGIQLPGRTARANMDILVAAGPRPVAIISCKWSARHDRMSDVTNECPIYKSAALQMHYPPIRYFVVTNELDGQRTDKNLTQPCMDGLALVHLPMTEVIGSLTPLMEQSIAMGRLMDLTGLVNQTHAWR